jgi:hypothetical protein
MAALRFAAFEVRSLCAERLVSLRESGGEGGIYT